MYYNPFKRDYNLGVRERMVRSMCGLYSCLRSCSINAGCREDFCHSRWHEGEASGDPESEPLLKFHESPGGLPHRTPVGASLPQHLAPIPCGPCSARFRVLWPYRLFPNEDSVPKTCALLPDASPLSPSLWSPSEPAGGALGMDSPVLTHPLCPSPESLRPLGGWGGGCQCPPFLPLLGITR